MKKQEDNTTGFSFHLDREMVLESDNTERSVGE